MRRTWMMGLIALLAGCNGLRNSADVRTPQPSGLVPLEEPEPTEGTYTDTTTPGTTTPGTTTPGTTTPGTTTPGTTTPGTTPTTTDPAIEACYPGLNADYSQCIELTELSPLPADYAYPAPLGGSSQYAEPTHFLDLAVADPAAQLAPNFRLDEFAQEFKGQWAVVQVHAVESVQSVRDDVGALVVNSAYRGPDYNAGIGGATYSRHMYGDGFDLDPVSVTLEALNDACLDNGAGYTQIYVSHVHCDWRDDTVDSTFYGGIARSALWTQVPEVTAEIQPLGRLLTAPAEGFDEGEPLRRWTAFDADGNELESVTGASYLPPVDAVEVEVTVGGVVTTDIVL